MPMYANIQNLRVGELVNVMHLKNQSHWLANARQEGPKKVPQCVYGSVGVVTGVEDNEIRWFGPGVSMNVLVDGLNLRFSPSQLRRVEKRKRNPVEEQPEGDDWLGMFSKHGGEEIARLIRSARKENLTLAETFYALADISRFSHCSEAEETMVREIVFVRLGYETEDDDALPQSDADAKVMWLMRQCGYETEEEDCLNTNQQSI